MNAAWPVSDSGIKRVTGHHFEHVSCPEGDDMKEYVLIISRTLHEPIALLGIEPFHHDRLKSTVTKRLWVREFRFINPINGDNLPALLSAAYPTLNLRAFISQRLPRAAQDTDVQDDIVFNVDFRFADDNKSEALAGVEPLHTPAHAVDLLGLRGRFSLVFMPGCLDIRRQNVSEIEFGISTPCHYWMLHEGCGNN